MTPNLPVEVHWAGSGWRAPEMPWTWLTPNEVTTWRRAGVHADAFLRKRYLLRRCLGHRSGGSPLLIEQMCPTCGTAGHGPVRARDSAGVDVSVSLTSHHDLAAAVCAVGRVGVDVVVHDDLDDPALDAALGRRERDVLQWSARPALWRARLWARKEAVVKAVGTGLRIEPRHLDVLGSSVTVDGVRLGLADAAVPGRRAVVAVAHDHLAPSIVWRAAVDARHT